MKEIDKKENNVCTNCGNEFDPGIFNRKYCSDECMKEFNRKKYMVNDYDKSDLVVCKICGVSRIDLRCHIKRTHKMEYKDYIKKFNCGIYDVICQKLLDKNKFINDNPGKGHNGSYSPYSLKFFKYEGLTEEEKQVKINELQKAQSDSLKRNGNLKSQKIYWIKKGYSSEEAEKKVSERQTTFSLEKCREKYGEVEGMKRWKKRQEKWMKTMSEKTDEEKDMINEKKFQFKSLKSGVSNMSKEFFQLLISKINPKLHQYITTPSHNNRETMIGMFSLDFTIGNIAVEFNGDVWHADPEKYSPDDYVLGETMKNKKFQAKYIWEKDNRKKKLVEDNGYTLFVVWEKDNFNEKSDEISKYINETLTGSDDNINNK